MEELAKIKLDMRLDELSGGLAAVARKLINVYQDESVDVETRDLMMECIHDLYRLSIYDTNDIKDIIRREIYQKETEDE
jgi:hypothetical protein